MRPQPRRTAPIAVARLCKNAGLARNIRASRRHSPRRRTMSNLVPATRLQAPIDQESPIELAGRGGTFFADYLLDDPPKRREAQFLFTSIYERFRLPFRALLFDRNVGFAPTNNIGLQHARGRYVCFLNSDAFPGTDDWLERLAQRLTQNPELGAVGPLLLYEDGSIQHQGMSFRRLNEFGGWYFGHHPGKGMHLADAKGMRRCISITGACMLLRRDLAERLHGFDESYAIGDFEDSDLCLRLYRMGLACAVDLDVHLFHLERKSQAGSAANWRMNLTLYNAWFHERRWAGAIAAHPQASAPVPFGDDTATEPQRYG